MREMISSNSLITLFRTNWRFTNVIGIPCDGKKIQTEPVNYGTCDCGLSVQLDATSLYQFEENSTSEFPLSRLMVDGWSSNVSYENYHAQCAPSSCWYSYLKHRPAVEVITSLLSLYGGMVVIMNVAVSMLLALWRKVFQQRPRQIQTTVTSM